MSALTVLVCSCGKRLKAAGATPGRLGRCPACGQLLRVPEDDLAAAAAAGPDEAQPTSPAPAPPHAPTAALVQKRPPDATRGRRSLRAAPGEASSAYVDARQERPDRVHKARARGWRRWLKPPVGPETRIRDSLRYPFWDAHGVAMLAFLAPVLWLTSLPVFGLLPVIFTSGGLILVLAPFGLGMTVFFALVVGYALVFLGRVLITSALGDVLHPRMPDCDFTTLLGGLGRWIWAGLAGFAVGGLPALAYWMYCGDLDMFDRVVLVELLALAMAYTQMALAASLLHNDFRAANPVTVMQAIVRVGWSYVVPCLVSGFAALLAIGALALLSHSPSVLAGMFGLWAFWVFALYEGMVTMRILGLCYHRHAAALGWFSERPRWLG